jgi:hypothetical protein
MEGASERKGRPRWLLWGGVALAVLLVLGAAFVGGRLLGRRPQATEVRFIPPEELPARPPEASGLVKEIQGNLITLEVPGPGGGAIYSGPEGVRKEGEWRELQVVVTQETQIFRRLPPSPEEMCKGGTVRGRVEEASLSEIEPNAQIEVWGREEGGRIVAEVICLGVTRIRMGP